MQPALYSPKPLEEIVFNFPFKIAVSSKGPSKVKQVQSM